MSFSFEIVAEDQRTAARAGMIHTAHGDIPTPVFAPVGTQGTVKSMTPTDLVEMGARLIVANTYHLYLRPGAELIAHLGGLHRFMAWNKPILTDSGGFQIFSLQGLRQIDDNGVTFRSHIDGSTHRLTPELVMEIQGKLGADIIMTFDECPEPTDYAYNTQALKRTHNWARRCFQAKKRSDQALYGIVQGGIFPDLRLESAKFLAGIGFQGYSIGGLSVGESKKDMHGILELLQVALPKDKPRYLMGVGSPEDLFECVSRGIDQFDCVLPTRIARNGAVFTHRGRINLRNAKFAQDPNPIEEDCSCYACRNFSKAYLRHLIIAREITALRLTTYHNLYFILQLMRLIRESILNGTYLDYKEDFIATFRPSKEEDREQEFDGNGETA